ncbi:Zn(2)-C6 fungal-type domain-containing protein [Mycena venus]|uniref:Zn(2)-C6 fungal-type domain-containing protein n=1 Tax=Mycena venus TaxID=2733690 RepID=A0A8H7D9Y1_9AGAR|nr:Zn(2)-C6 fungal-type domain-containing protein [Mycena venus]
MAPACKKAPARIKSKRRLSLRYATAEFVRRLSVGIAAKTGGGIRQFQFPSVIVGIVALLRKLPLAYMPKGTSNPRGRGPYAAQACTFCRSKKSKCDGVKPVCGSCAASGRDDECTWGRDVAPRKPRTEAHFEALRKRIDSLQAYADLLEGMLAKCICQDVSSHLKLRPQRFEDQSEEGGDSDAGVLDSDEEITQELTVHTQRLKLNDPCGGPLIHGGYFSGTVWTSLKLTPDIDWSRHLPSEVSMERREHDKILDVAFKFHTMFPIVPSLFLRDMYRALSVPRTENPPATPHYSPMLHNSVLAVCAVFSDNPYLKDPDTRRHFVEAAKAWFEGKKPDPTMVHSLAYIATFYTDCGEQVPAELYFGMSTRLSITLGLGVDPAQWVKAGKMSREESFARLYAYWSIFILDVTWALYWGRDAPPRPNTPMPFVDSEIDQIPWYYAPSKTSALCLIACQIADVVKNLRPEARPNVIHVAEHVTRIDLELNNWKSQLPPQLNITLVNRASSSPQRIMLHLAYWWCFITLHRPFFNRRTQQIQNSDPEVDHIKLCTRAADNVLDLLETWSSLYTMRLASLKMSGVIFAAGTVFLLRALQATGSSRVAHGVLNTALAQIETCIRYLREMGDTWVSGTRSADILQAILNDRVRPLIARRLAHRGEPIPTAASTSYKETPTVVSGVGAPHETNFTSWTEPAPSYASEWAPQPYPAAGWPETPLDADFFSTNAARPTRI